MELDVLDGMREMLRLHRPALVLELHGGVDRSPLLEILIKAGYSGEAVPINPEPGESSAQFLDNHNYAFLATQ